jgi:hypothetical protein
MSCKCLFGSGRRYKKRKSWPQFGPKKVWRMQIWLLEKERASQPGAGIIVCMYARGKQPAQHKHPLIEDECRHSLASGGAALFPALAHRRRRQFFPGGGTAQKLICHFSKVDTHQGGCGMNKTQRLCTAIIIHGDLY